MSDCQASVRDSGRKLADRAIEIHVRQARYRDEVGNQIVRRSTNCDPYRVKFHFGRPAGSFEKRGRQIKFLVNSPLEGITIHRRLKSRGILHFRRVRLNFDRDLRLDQPLAVKVMLDMANRFVHAVKVHTYRSIIHEANVHHCLEHAVFDPVFSIQGADLGDEAVV